MVVTSHAKCRQCGGPRHKTARLNLCKRCWEKVKPQVRAQWRGIKERRRQRQAVEAHIQDQQRLRLAAAMTTPTEPVKLTPEQAAAEIERIKAEGVPPVGDPARGPYMLLHKIAKSDGVSHGHGSLPLNREERWIARLYTDSDVPIHEIARGMHVAKSIVGRIRTRAKLPLRDAIPKWAPTGRIGPDEELTTMAGEPFFRDTATGKMRPVFPVEKPVEVEPASDPEPSFGEMFAPEAAPAPEPAAEPEAEPVAAEPTPEQRRKWRRWTPEEKAEVARLYIDASIPLKEIMDAYGIRESNLSRFASDLGAPTRRAIKAGHSVKGHIAQVNGRWQWVPELAEEAEAAESPTSVGVAPQPEPAVHQLHLGQAPGAQLEPVQALVPSPNGRAEVVHPPMIPTPGQQQHAWYVQFTVMHREVVGAASIDAAIAAIRQHFGDEVEVTMVHRA